MIADCRFAIERSRQTGSIGNRQFFPAVLPGNRQSAIGNWQFKPLIHRPAYCRVSTISFSLFFPFFWSLSFLLSFPYLLPPIDDLLPTTYRFFRPRVSVVRSASTLSVHLLRGG
jgi:hypothetical protein